MTSLRRRDMNASVDNAHTWKREHPWPSPDHPWMVHMQWRKLLFAHWALDPELVRPLIPQGLTLETFDGKAWITAVPFDMVIRPRAVPALGPLSHFLECNLRTYVTAQQKPGVWFFSLDAQRWLAVRGARRMFHLPYFDARMAMEEGADRTIAYRSERRHAGAPEGVFRARYRPVSEPHAAQPGSREHFLTERLCLYAADGHGLYRAEIHHDNLPLQAAEVEIEENTLGALAGFALEGAPQAAHYVDEIDVVGWLPQRLSL